MYYSDAYTGSGYTFDTTRKSGWIAESLAERTIPGVQLVAPFPLTEEQVLSVHELEYVEAVRTGNPRRLAESQGFEWDEGLWPMVLASSGGVVNAARSALRDGVAGSLSSGLHHARRASGRGFCTFNGLAIAARDVAEAGVDSVLILDLDAHCGGGTASLIAHDACIRQLDVSVSTVDAYDASERARLEIVESAGEYLPAIRHGLDELDRSGLRFGLCLYNAGMDPYEGCAIGGLAGITMEVLAEREQLVFDWCRGRGVPVAFTLAGGYIGPRLSRAELVTLHRMTLLAASGA